MDETSESEEEQQSIVSTFSFITSPSSSRLLHGSSSKVTPPTRKSLDSSYFGCPLTGSNGKLSSDGYSLQRPAEKSPAEAKKSPTRVTSQLTNTIIPGLRTKFSPSPATSKSAGLNLSYSYQQQGNGSLGNGTMVTTGKPTPRKSTLSSMNKSMGMNDSITAFPQQSTENTVVGSRTRSKTGSTTGNHYSLPGGK
jgi:hypothetical protein